MKLNNTCLIIALLFLSGICFAADTHWTNAGGGNFAASGNWSAGVPGVSDTAFFDLNNTYAVTCNEENNILKLEATTGTVTLDLNGWAFGITQTGGDDAAVIGHFDAAEMTLVGGAALNSGNTLIGREPGSHGILNIDGANTLWQVKRGDDWYSLFVGANGDGDMHITNGGTMDHGAGSVATYAISHANVTVDGKASLWRIDGYLAMGDQGTANVTVTEGAIVEGGRCDMAANSTARTTMTVHGITDGNASEFHLRSGSETSLTIGYYGAAKLTFENNGKLFNEGSLALAVYPGSYGELNLTDSWCDIIHLMSIGGNLDNAGGRGVANIYTNATLSVGETDPCDYLTIWRNGTVNLHHGTLEITALGEPLPITLHGRLTGAGMIWGNVSNLDGVIAPGATPGEDQVINIGNSYTQGPGGRFEIVINGNQEDLEYGKLYSGSENVVQLDGYLSVKLGNGFVPQNSDTFRIIASSGLINGYFINAQTTYTGPDGTFDVTYDGFNVILTNYRPLPACTAPPRADLNGDCLVNLLDFAVMADEWLTSGLSEEPMAM